MAITLVAPTVENPDPREPATFGGYYLSMGARLVLTCPPDHPATLARVAALPEGDPARTRLLKRLGKCPWDPVHDHALGGWQRTPATTPERLAALIAADRARVRRTGGQPCNLAVVLGPAPDAPPDAPYLIAADEDGEAGRAAGAALYGSPDRGLVMRTQSGGLRVVWVAPGGTALCTVGGDGAHEGLRLQGANACAVLAPSRGPAGEYRLAEWCAWDDLRPDAAPAAVLAAMAEAAPGLRRTVRRPAPAVPPQAREAAPPYSSLWHLRDLLHDGADDRSRAVFALVADHLRRGRTVAEITDLLWGQAWIAERYGTYKRLADDVGRIAAKCGPAAYTLTPPDLEGTRAEIERAVAKALQHAQPKGETGAEKPTSMTSLRFLVDVHRQAGHTVDEIVDALWAGPWINQEWPDRKQFRVLVGQVMAAQGGLLPALVRDPEEMADGIVAGALAATPWPNGATLNMEYRIVLDTVTQVAEERGWPLERARQPVRDALAAMLTVDRGLFISASGPFERREFLLHLAHAAADGRDPLALARAAFAAAAPKPRRQPAAPGPREHRAPPPGMAVLRPTEAQLLSLLTAPEKPEAQPPVGAVPEGWCTYAPSAPAEMAYLWLQHGDEDPARHRLVAATGGTLRVPDQEDDLWREGIAALTAAAGEIMNHRPQRREDGEPRDPDDLLARHLERAADAPEHCGHTAHAKDAPAYDRATGLPAGTKPVGTPTPCGVHGEPHCCAHVAAAELIRHAERLRLAYGDGPVAVLRLRSRGGLAAAYDAARSLLRSKALLAAAGVPTLAGYLCAAPSERRVTYDLLLPVPADRAEAAAAAARGAWCRLAPGGVVGPADLPLPPNPTALEALIACRVASEQAIVLALAAGAVDPVAALAAYRTEIGAVRHMTLTPSGRHAAHRRWVTSPGWLALLPTVSEVPEDAHLEACACPQCERAQHEAAVMSLFGQSEEELSSESGAGTGEPTATSDAELRRRVARMRARCTAEVQVDDRTVVVLGAPCGWSGERLRGHGWWELERDHYTPVCVGDWWVWIPPAKSALDPAA